MPRRSTRAWQNGGLQFWDLAISSEAGTFENPIGVLGNVYSPIFMWSRYIQIHQPSERDRCATEWHGRPAISTTSLLSGKPPACNKMSATRTYCETHNATLLSSSLASLSWKQQSRKIPTTRDGLQHRMTGADGKTDYSLVTHPPK